MTELPLLASRLRPASTSSEGCTRSEEDTLELSEERRRGRGAPSSLAGRVRALGLSVGREPDPTAEPARVHVDRVVAEEEVRRWEEDGVGTSGVQLGASLSRDGPEGDSP